MKRLFACLSSFSLWIFENIYIANDVHMCIMDKIDITMNIDYGPARYGYLNNTLADAKEIDPIVKTRWCKRNSSLNMSTKEAIAQGEHLRGIW